MPEKGDVFKRRKGDREELVRLRLGHTGSSRRPLYKEKWANVWFFQKLRRLV